MANGQLESLSHYDFYLQRPFVEMVFIMVRWDSNENINPTYYTICMSFAVRQQ
jgi:hypothetical protein